MWGGHGGCRGGHRCSWVRTAQGGVIVVLDLVLVVVVGGGGVVVLGDQRNDHARDTQNGKDQESNRPLATTTQCPSLMTIVVVQLFVTRRGTCNGKWLHGNAVDVSVAAMRETDGRTDAVRSKHRIEKTARKA